MDWKKNRLIAGLKAFSFLELTPIFYYKSQIISNEFFFLGPNFFSWEGHIDMYFSKKFGNEKQQPRIIISVWRIDVAKVGLAFLIFNFINLFY